ncbi:MAG: hypothetical protein DWG76_03330 [Chloroflexi bacterium]|nr:hypothetical protein [Chloroflexota bacterium]
MNQARLEKTILWTLLVLLLAGLLWFSYLGIFNRYWGDDWCINADFTELGLVENLSGYVDNITYTPSRYSANLFAGLMLPIGIPGLQAMTLIVIALLTGGLYRLLGHLAHFADLRLSAPARLTLAVLVSYFSIYLAPHRYQTFYWRTGLLTYTCALLSCIWLLVLLADHGRRAANPPWSRPLIGLIAFFGAGFSEAGNVLMVTTLLFLVVLCFWARTRDARARRLLPVAVFALAFALLGTALLVFSPSAATRALRYGPPAAPLEFIRLNLRYTWDFIRLSLLDLPLPHLAVAITAALLGALSAFSVAEETPWTLRRTLLTTLAIFLLVFLLVAAVYAPSSYVEKVPPHPRTRIIARTIMLLGLALIAWLAGRWTSALPRFARLRPIAFVLAALFVGLYIGRALIINTDLFPIYQSRAASWDARDAQLAAAEEQFADVVEVPAIDGQPVNGIVDFKLNANYYINRCAARLYGVARISGQP